jgi:hypothetical protein
MSGGLRKFFQRGIDRRNRTTRPGAPDDLSSGGVTGLDVGVPGSNVRTTPNRRPGRRQVDTPLGPKGGRRM